MRASYSCSDAGFVTTTYKCLAIAGKGYQLGMQVLGIVIIASWTCTLNGALFYVLHKVSAQSQRSSPAQPAQSSGAALLVQPACSALCLYFLPASMHDEHPMCL